jgi:hypothetical protein
MDWLTFFSEISKSLAWPICLGIVVTVFHKQISNLIQRIVKIDKEGITAISISEYQLEDSKISADQLLHDSFNKSNALVSYENNIRIFLKGNSQDTTENNVDLLVAHLAVTQLLLSFEQIHRQIFGSQIFLLKKLNEVALHGRPFSYLNDHFVHVKNLYTDVFNEWSVDQYLQFLFVNSLILRNDNQIRITDKGVEYLIWIYRNGIQDNKPL